MKRLDNAVAQFSKTAVSPTSQLAVQWTARERGGFGNPRYSRLGSLRYLGCGSAALRSVLPSGFLATWGLVLCLASAGASAQVDIAAGLAGGTPGATVPLPFVFQADSNITALQFDVLFDGTNFTSEAATAGSDALGHLAASALQTNGTRRVVLYSSTNAPLDNGIVVTVPFTIATDAPEGIYSVGLTNAIVSNLRGERVPLFYLVPGYLIVGTNWPPAQLRFPRFNQDGLRFVLTGTPETGYVVQASTNLTQWTSLSTNLAHGGVIFFRDTEALNFRYRFYRAVLLP